MPCLSDKRTLWASGVILMAMRWMQSYAVAAIWLHILLFSPMQAEGLTSFVEVSNDSEFPLENIPFGALLPKPPPTPCSWPLELVTIMAFR